MKKKQSKKKTQNKKKKNNSETTAFANLEKTSIPVTKPKRSSCLLYTSDAADD